MTHNRFPKTYREGEIFHLLAANPPVANRKVTSRAPLLGSTVDGPHSPFNEV